MADVVIHQFDDRGFHRLSVNGESSHWAMYEHPVEHAGYLAMTEYYGEEKVLKVEGIEVLTQQICRVCEKETGWNGETLPATTCEHQKKLYPTLVEGYTESEASAS